MPQHPGRFAAIDIGTVTCRLLIADVDGAGTLRELHRAAAITNLGEGVDASHRLAEAAMGRTCAQVAAYLRDVSRFADATHHVRLIATATSAARDAENAAEFAARLAAMGVQLAVIPGETEAALTFKGASAPYANRPLLVVDSGGGSTELIFGYGGHEPLARRSFNVGCRRVTERFLESDPPAPKEREAARAWYEPQFASFFAETEASGLHIMQAERVVAVAGTATSVVSVDLAMDPYDSSRVDGADVSLETLDAVRERLAAMTLEERRQVVGLQPDRAPVIVAGMDILACVVRAAGAASYTASESDILQGMVMEAAE